MGENRDSGPRSQRFIPRAACVVRQPIGRPLECAVSRRGVACAVCSGAAIGRTTRHSHGRSVGNELAFACAPRRAYLGLAGHRTPNAGLPGSDDAAGISPSSARCSAGCMALGPSRTSQPCGTPRGACRQCCGWLLACRTLRHVRTCSRGLVCEHPCRRSTQGGPIQAGSVGTTDEASSRGQAPEAGNSCSPGALQMHRCDWRQACDGGSAWGPAAPPALRRGGGEG